MKGSSKAVWSILDSLSDDWGVPNFEAIVVNMAIATAISRWSRDKFGFFCYVEYRA